jgi:biotin-dependent carboxylase-like uncharacterized protein
MTATLAAAPAAAPVQTSARMTVLRAGALTTFQDRGRFGFAHFGVTAAGPADPESFRLVNRLTGNREDSAVLELTLGGFAATLTEGRWAALTGAPAPVRVGGRPVVDPFLFWIPPEVPFEIGFPKVGLRSYFTFSGGFRADPVLGSLATDTLSGLGPPVLREGSDVDLGDRRDPEFVTTDTVCFRAPVGEQVVIRFRWGPRDALFSAADQATLTKAMWTVSSDSNRVGTTLTGPSLQCRYGSLPSEGTPLGAIQIPPSGQPIVFMPDHPVTGGYPVIGVVTDDDIGYLAQARPGSRIKLQSIS